MPRPKNQTAKQTPPRSRATHSCAWRTKRTYLLRGLRGFIFLRALRVKRFLAFSAHRHALVRHSDTTCRFTGDTWINPCADGPGWGASLAFIVHSPSTDNSPGMTSPCHPGKQTLCLDPTRPKPPARCPFPSNAYGSYLPKAAASRLGRRGWRGRPGRTREHHRQRNGSSSPFPLARPHRPRHPYA